MYEGVLSTGGQTGYFASLPTQQLALQSQETFFGGEDTSGVGNCFSGDVGAPLVGGASTVNLTSLGFVPPYHLE